MYILAVVNSRIDLIARGDRKRAMTMLRGGYASKTHHFSTFRSGMMIGLALPAFVDGIYKSS